MVKKRSRANLMVGLGLIGLGAIFLVGQFIDIGDFIWPFIIIAIGGLFFAGMLTGGKTASGLAIPGSILTTVGLILLFQNIFGYWEAWTYAWTLILASVGIGIFIHGVWSGQEEARRGGLGLAKAGLILFLILGALFELGASLLGFRRAGGLLWPLALIGLGLYLLLGQARLFFGRGPAVDPARSPGLTEPREDLDTPDMTRQAEDGPEEPVDELPGLV